MLQIDTASGRAELLSANGLHLADVHFTLVDSTWFMWLSVDPLADQNIQSSPYMYCNGNPIMLIDPDGQDDFDVDIINQRITQIATTTGDHFYLIGADGTRYDTGLVFRNGIFSTENINGDGAILKSKDALAIEQVFQYMSSHTGVEWREASHGSDQFSYVGTSFLNDRNSIGSILRNRGLVFMRHVHSHPGGTITEDKKDREEAKRWIEVSGNQDIFPKFYIFALGQYFEYTSIPDLNKAMKENLLEDITIIATGRKR